MRRKGRKRGAFSYAPLRDANFLVGKRFRMADSKDFHAVSPRPDSAITHGRDLELPPELSILGVDNFVLFPFMIAPFIVSDAQSKQLVDDALRGDRLIGVFLRKSEDENNPFNTFSSVGTVGLILKMLRMPDSSVRLLLHGIERIRIIEPISGDPYPRAHAEKIGAAPSTSRNMFSMIKQIQSEVGQIVQRGHLPEDMGAAAMEMTDPSKLADLVAANLSLKIAERQEVLEAVDIEKRVENVLHLLEREIDLLELGNEIQTKVRSRLDKVQRDYMLREQMKTIQKELGEDDSRNPEVRELEEAIEKAELPQYALGVAERELKRLESMPMSSPEYAVSRNYLDWIVALPWHQQTIDNIDIENARAILDEDHYGLEDVKERIIEQLAVFKLKKAIRGPILCFVGPPGVGKTSMGMSIARAIGRKFCRFSLGGMRDEAEIRGHRRTYIGALPGRILKGIRDAGANNPLIMLDEIDKIGKDFRGDPASALLEVLDPQQNSTFTDHYLDMPFDLSRAMFITTANMLDTIPMALLDRMEVIRLSGYTTAEKVEIANRYLVPRGLENTGVTRENLEFHEDGIRGIIENYTREAGVRNLEREIENVCRKTAKQLARGEDGKRIIHAKGIEEILGPVVYRHEMAQRTATPGVAIGLAWTQTGGEIMFVETTTVPGSGTLMMTGQLGDVMKESAMAAINYLHANLDQFGLPERVFEGRSFHIHVPSGATPKDGPSAGIAIATALCSMLTGRPVHEGMAMTGEITLKGYVLPVGGIREKILAAHRAGIREVILPMQCRARLEKEVSPEIRNTMKFHYVEHVMEVLRLALLNESERENETRRIESEKRQTEFPRPQQLQHREPQRDHREPQRDHREPQRPEERHASHTAHKPIRPGQPSLVIEPEDIEPGDLSRASRGIREPIRPTTPHRANRPITPDFDLDEDTPEIEPEEIEAPAPRSGRQEQRRGQRPNERRPVHNPPPRERRPEPVAPATPPVESAKEESHDESAKEPGEKKPRRRGRRGGRRISAARRAAAAAAAESPQGQSNAEASVEPESKPPTTEPIHAHEPVKAPAPATPVVTPKPVAAATPESVHKPQETAPVEPEAPKKKTSSRRSGGGTRRRPTKKAETAETPAPHVEKPAPEPESAPADKPKAKRATKTVARAAKPARRTVKPKTTKKTEE
jgi:ATP-dependent Lon protease